MTGFESKRAAAEYRRPPRMKRNKFAGLCYKCKILVLEGQGFAEWKTGAPTVRHARISEDGMITCDEARARKEAGRVQNRPSDVVQET